MPQWIKFIKIIDALAVSIASGVFVWAILGNNISAETTILITAGLFAVRGLIVGALYYRDMKRTFRKSVWMTIADAMFWVTYPFNSDAYLRRRNEALRKDKSERTLT